jgi:hypothetical protein
MDIGKGAYFVRPATSDGNFRRRSDTPAGAQMPIGRVPLYVRGGLPVRQWELFGITDDDPYWTPPRPSEPATIAFVPDLDEKDDEALVPEPAA